MDKNNKILYPSSIKRRNGIKDFENTSEERDALIVPRIVGLVAVHVRPLVVQIAKAHKRITTGVGNLYGLLRPWPRNNCSDLC
jgi:hypothetical protein